MVGKTQRARKQSDFKLTRRLQRSQATAPSHVIESSSIIAIPKVDPNRVRITVGGNLLKDNQELTVRTADLTTSKVLWNSTISTKGARYMCSDINGFYLDTPPPEFEYMKMSMRDIP